MMKIIQDKNNLTNDKISEEKPNWNRTWTQKVKQKAQPHQQIASSAGKTIKSPKWGRRNIFPAEDVKS